MWAEVFAIFGLFLLSATKFMMAPGAILASGYDVVSTIIITFCGGVAGSIFFFKLGGVLFGAWEKWFPSKRKKRKFSAKNRIIIQLKNRFGVVGLAFLIPLISIPISAVLAAKYFRFDKKAIPAYVAASAVWSVLLTLFSQPVITFVKSLFV